MVGELKKRSVAPVTDFLELAPENWMNLGGRLAAQFDGFAERYPLVCHGLSLSVGSQEPLDTEFLYSLKHFLDRYQIVHYSEHLSYCSEIGRASCRERVYVSVVWVY